VPETDGAGKVTGRRAGIVFPPKPETAGIEMEQPVQHLGRGNPPFGGKKRHSGRNTSPHGKDNGPGAFYNENFAIPEIWIWRRKTELLK